MRDTIPTCTGTCACCEIVAAEEALANAPPTPHRTAIAEAIARTIDKYVRQHRSVTREDVDGALFDVEG
jgi:hypothetical protein